MTFRTRTYEFTAFTEDALLEAGGGLAKGDRFTVPSAADTEFAVEDDDGRLSGDFRDRALDRFGQTAEIDGGGSGSRIYAEKYYFVRDKDGNWYILVEIEQEGSSDDYFTFYGDVPPPETEVEVRACIDAPFGVPYENLGAGEVDDPGTASLSGRYFCDENRDDVDSGLDPAISGVLVTLLSADGTAVAETTTDANGEYWFVGLKPGEYVVQFDAEVGKEFVARDTGGDPSGSDVDPATGATDVIVLGRGEAVTGIDAGIAKPTTASLSGRYFCDENRDDLDNEDEPGIAGSLVLLRAVDGSLAAETTTDADGFYWFEDLAPGEYVVQFAEVSGKGFVARNVGDDDRLDSDVDPLTGLTAEIFVERGDTVSHIDAGVAPPEEAFISETDLFLF